MIYDEESDRHVHISFKEALYATCIGSSDTDLNELDAFKWEDISDESVALVKGHVTAADVTFRYGQGQYTKATNADQWKALFKANSKGGKAQDLAIALVQAGIWCPCEIVIARPFIEHLMLSAIVTVAGRETGATLFGPAGAYFGCCAHHLKHARACDKR